MLYHCVSINNCFSCLWVANTKATCSNKSPTPPEEFPDRLCHLPSVDLSNTTWAQRGLINKLPGNACGSHRAKAIIKYRNKHSTIADYKVKVKESDKIDKYLDITIKLKKAVEHESDCDTNSK